MWKCPGFCTINEARSLTLQNQNSGKFQTMSAVVLSLIRTV